MTAQERAALEAVKRAQAALREAVRLSEEAEFSGENVVFPLADALRAAERVQDVIEGRA